MMNLILLEWKTLWRDRRLPAVLCCFLVLGSIALWSTSRSNAMTARTSTMAERMEYARWLDQGPKYAHAAAHYGVHVFRPTTRLQNFEPGVAPYVGETVYLEAHVQDPLLYRPADDRVASRGLGELTPSLLIFVNMPLLIVLLGFDMVTGNRTAGAGWLTQLAAQSTSRLLGSKWLALSTLTSVPALAIVLLSYIAARFTWQVPLPGEALRWLLIALLCCASTGFWAAISVACSSLSRTAGQSLALLITCWVSLCLIAPRAICAFAGWRVPTITQQELSASIQKATGEGEDGDREKVLKQALFQQYGVHSLEAVPVEWDGMRRQAAEEAGNGIFDAFWGRLFEQYAQQQAIAAELSFLSPVTAFTALNESLTGSSILAQTAFIRQAEGQRRLIQRTMNQELSRKRAPNSGDRPNASPTLWKKVPPFHYFAATLRQDTQANGHSFWFALFGATVQLALAACILTFAIRRSQTA